MKNWIAALIALLVLPGASGAALSQGVPAHTSAQSLFMERCGGCHGLRGTSVAENVPDLAGVAGYFLCTRESRAFAARLPNVMFARLPDSDLATVLNYVMFDLGGASADAGHEPYTAEEIAIYRAEPLAVTDLHSQRRAVVTKLVADCGAPEHLLDYQRPRGVFTAASKEK